MSFKFISNELLETIKRRFDIVDVIGQYVPLKKSGRNFSGLCPFHSEKTPSFSVSPEKQIYHCFGCGAGGDVFRFIMDTENLTFQEVVQHLANEAGIIVPQFEESHPDPNDQTKRKLFEAYDVASKLYHYILLETKHGQEALNYLLKRGFSRDLIETFHIGYSPPAWDTLKNFLLKRGFAIDLLEQAGLVIQKEEGKSYDRFRNRIMFPIFDAKGRVIAFGGRVLDDSQPKYLNSPETLIFNKSRTLYNIQLASKEIRKKRQAILFEGYVDTISAWNAGVFHGIATLGTSLTDIQAQVLRRYAEEVLISYDSDQAGQQAAYRAIDVLQQAGCKVHVVQMPQGLDPDDYIRQYGADAFKKDILDSAITATAYKLQFIRKDYDLKHESERINYITNALEVISDLHHAVEREHYLKELSEEFQISLDSLKKDQAQIYYSKRKKKEKTRDNLTIKWNNIINNGEHVGRQQTLYPAYYNAEKYLIYLMMKNLEIAERVKQEIGSEFHIEDFSVLAAYIYSYYGKGYDPDISRFISTLEDNYYVQLATQIAMLEIHDDVSEEELNDYIAQVKRYRIELKIREKREEQIKADRNKDVVKSVQIGQEIIQLYNQMKSGEK